MVQMTTLDHFTREHAEPASVSDAIVLSGWYWNTFNVPERIALALSILGIKVLYCENPVSLLRHRGRVLQEVEHGIYGFGPEILGPRLNHFPFMSTIQAGMIVRQILRHSTNLTFKNRFLVYPHGQTILPVCRQMKERGFFLVHVCMDYPQSNQEEHVRLSDLTLVIPETVFHKLKGKFGSKVRLMPQSGSYVSAIDRNTTEPPELARIPRPRLGYLGPAADRLNLEILRSLLSDHPDWHFVSFGLTKSLPMTNAHVIPWRTRNELPHFVANLDVGLMPYDCFTEKNFHCVPLKIFDYFAMGIPVVSTPLVNLREYNDLVYFGDDAQELNRAVAKALQEPSDSPRRKKRMEVARRHSIENVALCLRDILSEKGVRVATHSV